MNCRRAAIAVGVLACVLAASPPADASERSVAQRLVVIPADSGAGFSVTPGSVSDPKTFASVATCVGKPSARRITVSAGGPVLTSAQDGSSITSSVDILRSKSMVTHDVAVMSSPNFASCLGRVIQQGLAAQGVEDVGGIVLAPFNHYGTFSTAVQLTLSGTSNGQPQQLSVTDVFIQKGRAELTIGFSALGGQRFDAARAESVLDKVARRLGAAPG